MFHRRIAGVLATMGALLLGVALAGAPVPVSAGEGPTTISYRKDASSASMPMADRIVVRKSERRLELMHKGQVLRSYRIALGLQPVGHKERSGDFRTPEGRYQLSRRNPRSDFFLSIQISYPSEQDIRHAKANGWDPGGAIMIHGLPNVMKKDLSYYQTRDWTDGCIAVSNSDMVEIWLMTRDNTPIEILP